MDLNPQLPLPPTLTLSPTTNVPPDKTPEPSLSVLFPENTPYRVAGNPFRGSRPKALSEEHRKALQEALGGIRAPFLFSPKEPINFDGECLGTDTSADSFNAAVVTVIAAVERGYYLTQDPTPLNSNDWATLTCALVAAIGQGYHWQYATDQEAKLEKVSAGAVDPDP